MIGSDMDLLKLADEERYIWDSVPQPRSGERLQPTAQAVGSGKVIERAPEGWKNGYAATLFSCAPPGA